MKRIYISLLLLPFCFTSFAQNYNANIDSLINKVNGDSLISYVRILSGEDSVYIGGTKSLIKQRIYNSNDLAADYLSEKLVSYGYDPEIIDYSSKGTNIVVTKLGTINPDRYYMICAHYDAVTFYAADDNASGSATVLEAARILKDIEIPNSVIFAFWDEEEIGLKGSKNYAYEAAADQKDIRGVVNIDMIGWDSDDDGLIEIHTDDVANSEAIANVMVKVNDNYDLQLDPQILNPGTGASDHASFWNNDFGAVLLIEGYYSDDFNPYYHTAADRVSKFNDDYFHSAAQLAFGTTATLAIPNQIVGIKDEFASSNPFSLKCYPNPATDHSTISYSLKESSMVNLILVSSLGQRIVLTDQHKAQAGEHTLDLDLSRLPSGIYSVLLYTAYGQSTQKIVLTR